MSDLPAILSEIELFAGSTKKDLQVVASIMQVISLQDGEVLVQECSADRNIYILTEGRVGVYKRVASCSDEGEVAGEHQIASLDTGEIIGEMSFLEKGEGRSATIRALGEVKVLSLSPEDFERFYQKNGKNATLIMQNLAIRISQRLRGLNKEKVQRLEAELETAKTRNLMSRMISNIILLLFGYNLTLQLTMELSQEVFFANLISFGIVTVFGIMLVILAARSHLSWQEYGLSIKNWKPAVIESMLWTLGAAGALTLLKGILILAVPQYRSLPLFGPFQGDFPFLPILIYAALAPVQEFIARGVLQSSFERFYSSKNKVFMSVLFSNALFSAAHVHLSSLFAASVFFPGLLWGYLYHRHKTIIGVSISHILLGLYAVYILRFVMMANI
jgi:CRP-like cAMP-binding protein/membrane protease YdiL (CAAX protease family)